MGIVQTPKVSGNPGGPYGLISPKRLSYDWLTDKLNLSPNDYNELRNETNHLSGKA